MDESSAPLDEEALLDLVDDDEEMLTTIIDLFLDQYPEYMNDIREAVEEEDADALEQAAHTLQGAVGNIQAADVREVAVRLEQKGISGDFDGVPELVDRLEQEMEELRVALNELKGSF